ncbi:ribonuclease E activity regulator RraA [Streptomyces sp. 061-3]|uniref:ribonuclease E activity regulator RraA n=1 Tax=Streptomyces sp. 061-3 TaxID=2789268 RepID=UPI0039807572
MQRASPIATADLADKYGDQLRICDVQFTSYGAVHSFAGPVGTLSCSGDNSLFHELLRTPGEGYVAVVDGGASLHSAPLGDLMAERAHANGWAGVVVYGAVRDSALLAGMDIGIHALGHQPRKSAKAGAGSVDEPVSFGGVTFTTGDILHADHDGVVLLPTT